MRTDGRTDMTKLMVALGNFANGRKNELYCESQNWSSNINGCTTGRDARRTPSGSKRAHASPRDIDKVIGIIARNWKRGIHLPTSITLCVSKDRQCMYV